MRASNTMKAYTVLAVARDGEFVCWDCMTAEEKAVARDEKEIDNVSVLFAADVVGTETCGRCGEVVAGTD